MKQHIDVKQLNELSDKGKKKLRKWWKPIWSDIIYNSEAPKMKEFQLIAQYTAPTAPAIKIKNPNYLPLLLIGQMIEFLDENQDYQFHIFRRTIDWKVIVGDLQYGKVIPGELCDFLWEAIKEILEK